MSPWNPSYGIRTALSILRNRQYNINPDYRFFEGTVQKSLLTKAIENMNYQIMHELVARGATTNFDGLRMETPLITAAKIGAPDIVQYLLSIGANPNAQDTFGNTALHYAVGAGGRTNLAVVNALIRGSGREIETIHNVNGETPLMVAIRNRAPSVIRALVDSDRFDVTKIDDSGISPILEAIRLGIDLNTLEAILQKATLPPRDIMDYQARDAYYYVRQYRNNNVSLVRLLDKYQELKEEE